MTWSRSLRKSGNLDRVERVQVVLRAPGGPAQYDRPNREAPRQARTNAKAT
jgi:hypothetical protein